MINFRLCLALILVLPLVEGAVRPPPWADPQLNPCADKPKGWQYIYWPADGQCYKIFQIGYPCPETMELVPAISKRRPRSVKAECRCPPASVFHETDGRCYEIYKNGPCPVGQYISPQKENSTNQEYKLRVGVCKNVEPCPDADQISWPVNGKCYCKHTQGPCSKGQLLDLNADMLPVCTCSNENELSQYYWEHNKACYEHYTKGPCQEKGHLFLPDRVCDCHAGLPHYHSETNQCYELGSTGPCKTGHQFKIDDKSNSSYASCKCKDSYIYWPSDGNCYRPYTQGPCPITKILVNSTSCMTIPCGKGTLYFPEQKTCYRVGSQGPCPVGQIVIFDFRARPSIDGISYNGLCGCAGQLNGDNSCLKEKRSAKSCEAGMVVFKNNCYKLYTQGPCTDGQWLVPNRQGRVQLWQNGGNTAKCDCKPGYTTMVSNNTSTVRCLPPTVSLANYLNKYFVKQS